MYLDDSTVEKQSPFLSKNNNKTILQQEKHDFLNFDISEKVQTAFQNLTQNFERFMFALLLTSPDKIDNCFLELRLTIY